MAATCRLVNRSTGSTPGRLFQISTSRDPDHWAGSAASSCELLKLSVPSWRSSIFCGESKTVMLLSTSIANVIKFLSSGYSSSMTFIPLVWPHMQGNCWTVCASKRRVRASLDGGRERPFELDSFAPQSNGCVGSVQTMQVEMKFLRLCQPAALGEQIDGWKVYWVAQLSD